MDAKIALQHVHVKSSHWKETEHLQRFSKPTIVGFLIRLFSPLCSDFTPFWNIRFKFTQKIGPYDNTQGLR